MCSGSKREINPSKVNMETGFEKQSEDGFFVSKSSVLLELSACDDLEAFKSAVEETGFDVDEASFWYGRRIGSRKMGFEERTPLMIASMYGSKRVLKYIIDSGKAQVNRSCGSDKATALHCAAAGGSGLSLEAVRLLLEASADPNSVNSYGNRPVDLLAPGLGPAAASRRKAAETLLRGEDELIAGGAVEGVEEEEEELLRVVSSAKKEYPVDVSLPDINNGIYGSDDFRMYSFKIKPCSRAYSHDWTECPFVHPGENARRRDPRKYPYSCVPCPEFRKGSCAKGDSCEYAHGVFESWLHPAQYRTRLCKDETGCARKVCFFAHKVEELRPVYASTGSAMPSPRSLGCGGGSADMAAALSPLALGPSSMSLPATSTPPMSPLAAAASSPKSSGLWQQSKVSLTTPPALQLPGSRLKTARCARDLDLELLSLENQAAQQQQQQQLLEEISRLSAFNPTNLDDMFGSSSLTHLQSPTGGLQMRQGMSQLRTSYPASLSSTLPIRKPSQYGLDPSSASSMAAAVMSSRAAAFKQRSQSFVDRGAHHNLGLTAAANSAAMMSPSSLSSSSNFSDWGSPDGRLDWAVQGDELNKFRKSASFGFRSSNNNSSAGAVSRPASSAVDEPDVSWVHSLVKDVPVEKQQQHYNHSHRNQMKKGVHEVLPPWVEQMYIEQEQLVA